MPEAKQPSGSIQPNRLAQDISRLALSKKAEDVHILDVRKITPITDYFVICSGTTDVHVKAIHDAILRGLEPEVSPWHVEGIDALRWVLMDYIDVVVHVFQPKVRDYYQLERLWADAKTEILEDQPTQTP